MLSLGREPQFERVKKRKAAARRQQTWRRVVHGPPTNFSMFRSRKNGDRVGMGGWELKTQNSKLITQNSTLTRLANIVTSTFPP
jgi:hypothetical protein